MADIKSINPVNVEQAGIIFGDIAEHAMALKELAMEMIDEGDSNFDYLKCVAIRELSSKLGFMADLGAGRLGATQAYGGVEAWLLPSAYRRAAEGVSA
jgi:phage FluMu protein gp41